MTINPGLAVPIVIRNRLLTAYVLSYWHGRSPGQERWRIHLMSPRGHRVVILERSLSPAEWDQIHQQIKSFWLFLLDEMLTRGGVT